MAAGLKAGTLDPCVHDARGFTLLHAAAQNGRTALVEMLLQSGANPHALNAVKWSPLDYAIRFRYEAIITLLRDQGSIPSVAHLSSGLYQPAAGSMPSRRDADSLKPLSLPERALLQGMLGLTPRGTEGAARTREGRMGPMTAR